MCPVDVCPAVLTSDEARTLRLELQGGRGNLICQQKRLNPMHGMLLIIKLTTSLAGHGSFDEQVGTY